MLDKYFFLANSAYNSGYLIGSFLWPLLLCMGILKCSNLAQKPKTAKKCVYALSFVLVAWLLLSILHIFSKNDLSTPLVQVLAALAAGVLCIIGFVLAVLGFMDLHSKKEEFEHGFRYGVYTFILGGFIVSVWSFNFYQGFMSKRMALTKEYEQPAPSKPGKKIVNAQFNYSIKTPGRPWVSLKAKKINPLAQLAFSKAPGIFFMVLAEKPGIEIPIELDGYVEVVKANLKSLSGRFVTDGPKRIGKYPGHLVETDAMVSGLKVSYAHGLISRNGYLYQLILWSVQPKRSELRKAMNEIFPLFSITDLKRIAHSPGMEPLDNFTSKKFGYTISLKDSGWQKWADFEKEVPEAEYAVTKDQDWALAVYPCHLFDLDLHPDAITRGLFSCMDIAFPNKDLVAPKIKASTRETPTQPMPNGFTRNYGFHRILNGVQYDYYLRVIRSGAFCYLIAVWHSHGPTTDAERAQVADRVRIARPTDAMPVLPLAKREQDWHTKIINDAGLYYYDARQYEKSITCFKQAFECNKRDEVVLGNYLGTLSDQGRDKEALAYLEKHLDFANTRPSLRARHANLLRACGQSEKAIEIFEDLFRTSFTDDDYFLSYLSLLETNKETDKALEEIERYLKKTESLSIRIRKAYILKRADKVDEAVAVLRQELKKTPKNHKLRYRLIDILSGAQRHHSVLEECDTLFAGGLASGDAYYYKGRAETGLKWYRKAKASFELGLKKEPTDQDLKDYLEHVSGLLGEGENSNIKNPIDPVALPPALQTAPVATDAEPYLKGYSAHYLQRIIGYEFGTEKPRRKSTYIRVKINSAEGLKRFSSFSFEFDPLYEEIYVNRLHVLDEHGKIVRKHKTSDFYVMDSSDRSIASQDKRLHLPVSGLKPGYEIDLLVTKRDFHPAKHFNFIERTLSQSYPVLRSALFVRGPVEKLAFRSNLLPAPQKTPNLLLWSITRPTVYQWEPSLQDVFTFLPTVFISDAKESWKTIATKYLEDLDAHLQPDAKIQNLGKMKCAGIATPKEKIRALAKFLQDGFTYKAIEFGRRARIPNTAAKIVENKYGDCKDHALLLHHLLKGAGIDSHLALVNSGGLIQSELPSLDQFNHMVLQVPILGERHIIDGTDKHLDPTLPTPRGLGGSKALILDRENIRLIQLNDYPKKPLPVSIQRQCEILSPDVRVQEQLTLHEYCAANMRAYLKGIEVSNRKKSLQSYLEEVQSSMELQTFEVIDLENQTKPLVIKLTYLLKGAAVPAGGQIHLSLPRAWEKQYFSTPYVERRRFPFEFSHATNFSCATHFAAPIGYAFGDLTPLNTAKKQAPYAEWQIAAKVKDAGATVSFNGISFNGKFKADAYAPYKKAVDSLFSDLARKVVLVKK